jgi:hypothetical protein
VTHASWVNAPNWQDAFFQHETQNGQFQIGVGERGAHPSGLASLEETLATHDCDTSCRPAAGGRRTLNDGARAIFKDHFFRYGPKYDDAARRRLAELAGIQGASTVTARASGSSILNVRAIPARPSSAISRYAPALKQKLGDFGAWIEALKDPQQMPAFILAKELRERQAELDALPQEEAAMRVAHIALDYADIFDGLFKSNPKARFSGIIDSHIDQFLSVLSTNPHAPYYLGGDPDGDYLGNFFEILYGFDPLKKEETYKKPGDAWNPYLGLGNTIWLPLLEKWDRYLESTGRLSPTENGALRDGAFPSTQFLLNGPDMTGEAMRELVERDPFNSTRLDFVLPFLEKAGKAERIEVAGESPALLEALFRAAGQGLAIQTPSGWSAVKLEGAKLRQVEGGREIKGEALSVMVTVLGRDGVPIAPPIAASSLLARPGSNTLTGASSNLTVAKEGWPQIAELFHRAGYRVAEASGAPVTMRLDRTVDKPIRTIEQATKLPLHGREWKLVPEAAPGTQLQVVAGDGSGTGVSVASERVELGVARAFAPKIFGVDFINGKGESVALDKEARIVAFRVDDKDKVEGGQPNPNYGRLIDKGELAPRAELVANESGQYTWTLGFSDRAGQRIDAKEVGLFLALPSGELQADGMIGGRQNNSFAGMCLENSIFRHFTATQPTPRPERGARGFTKDDIEKLFATALISATATADLLRGDSYRGSWATILFKNGTGVKNVGIPEGTFDLLPTAARMDGMVGIPGASLRGYLKFTDGYGAEKIIDSYLIEKFELETKDGKPTITVTYWDKFFRTPTNVTIKELPEGLSFDDAKVEGAKRILVNSDDQPFRGKIYATFSNGTKKAYDPSDIAFIHQTTMHDISMIQTLQFIHVLSTRNGGVGAFKGDNNISESVNNEASWVDTVSRFHSAHDPLPDWAKELQSAKRLVGLQGEVSAEDRQNIVFYEAAQGGTPRFRGWALIEPKLGWVVNGAVTMNQFDTLRTPDPGLLDWKAPNLYNAHFTNEDILAIYVESLTPAQRATASKFLPEGWQRWIPAAERDATEQELKRPNPPTLIRP